MSRKNLPTRDRILEAAWHLLETGGGTVRMSDIAKRAGVSRQAVYLHFPNRAELLIATTRYIDDIKRVDDRLAPSRAATLGPERLTAYIEAWGNYIPEIYGVGSALMAMGDSDEEARQAWADRMCAVREGCAAAVAAIKADGRLPDGYTLESATDLLWTLLSVENWEQLTQQCGWSQKDYISRITKLAKTALVK
jgi:AcrR family transcriptional regulator